MVQVPPLILPRRRSIDEEMPPVDDDDPIPPMRPLRLRRINDERIEPFNMEEDDDFHRANELFLLRDEPLPGEDIMRRRDIY